MGNCLPVLEKDAASKETNKLLAQLVESQKEARKKQENRDAKLQQALEQMMCESDTESEVDNLSSTTDASSKKAHKGSKKQRGRKGHPDLYLMNKVAQVLDEVAKGLKPLPGMQD